MGFVVINMEIYVKSFGDIKIIQFDIAKRRRESFEINSKRAEEQMSAMGKQ